jgi:hypothetical protein
VTELEEAELTMKRALAATRMRRAWGLTNEASTEFRNETRFGFRNDAEGDDAAIA